MKPNSIILLLIADFASYSSVVQAQIVGSRPNLIASPYTYLAQKIELITPSGDAPIGRRRGGASRGNCAFKDAPLTALVPGIEEPVSSSEHGNQNQTISKSFLVSTVAEYPSFWFYIPELPANARLGEFILQDELDRNGRTLSIALSEKPGIIGVRFSQLPQYALETGKQYHWYFKIYCDDPESTKDYYYYVDGWIKRVATTPTDAESIWFNTLTHLAEDRLNHPQDISLEQDWVNHLKSVGLEDIAEAPIVQDYRE